MSKPTVLLLSMDDAQQADVRLALKDVANVVRSKTPAELIADEYRNLNPGAAIVAVRPDAPNRFGLIHNVAAVVSHLSGYYHLEPGDIIYTGTPEGVGPVVAGDLIEGSIEGLSDISLRVGTAD